MRQRSSPVEFTRLFGVCLVLLALTGVAAVAAPQLPPLSGRVVDQAGLLDAGQEAALVARLEALEAETSNQMVVVTVPDLQGYDIAEFALELGRQWGIGQADKNNGLVLLVAPTERKVRFEVGYGLEAFMTDATSSYIIQKEIIPAFREGNFPKGISNGVDAAIGAMNGSYIPDLSNGDSDNDAMAFMPLVMVVLIAITHFLQRARKKDIAGRVMLSGVAGMMVFMVSKVILFGVAAAVAVFVITLFTGLGGGGSSSSRAGSSSGGFGHSHGSSRGGGFSGGGGGFGGGGASGGW